MDPVQEGIMGKEFHAFRVHQPTDETLGIFPLEPREQGGRPQDISLSPAFDHENLFDNGFIMNASFTDELKLTGFIPFKIETV
jgi:hypothetical protein